MTIPLALGACGYRPAYPPPLQANDYLEYRQSALPAGEDAVGVRIAGARLANGGVYLDVLVNSRKPDEDQLRYLASELGSSLSIHDPSEEGFIEMTDSEGRTVRLKSMKYPESFNPGVLCTLYAQPPTYRLDDHRFIATCMFRTARQLRPGAYRIRFHEGWDSWYYGDNFIPADRDWHTLQLDWSRPPDS